MIFRCLWHEFLEQGSWWFFQQPLAQVNKEKIKKTLRGIAKMKSSPKDSPGKNKTQTPLLFLTQKKMEKNHSPRILSGWCSTPTLLLICSSFNRENGHPLLICSSLSVAQFLVRKTWKQTLRQRNLLGC